jgi:large subunit ribosomal protein L17
MRHKNLGRKLGIRADHRKAQRMNMLTALIKHGRVVTTLAKAKEYRRHADRIVTLAKVRSLHRIRQAAAQLNNDRDVVKRLFDVIGPMFTERAGGYSRVLRLAKPRIGDAAPRAILEWVGESERREKAAEQEKALADEKSAKGRKKKKAAPAEEPEGAEGKAGAEAQPAPEKKRGKTGPAKT